MKITIAYSPEEDQKAKTVLHFLQSFLADSVVKVKESSQHTPFSHIYLTTRRPEKPTSN